MANKKYSAEFKREVLAMVAEGSRSIAQLERELGITSGLIYKWQKATQTTGVAAQPSAEQTTEVELRRVRRELDIVRQERDILKKAIQVFSRGDA